ncbi:hypothetical protein H2O64_09585 [Kordia sp. YSTF-M3]|uniref:DNA primase n=1 Tax=Kordia aestuariivivens TaxID=2759037 RepID=A0ABR7Q8M8_9FLAO|nr:hypothetical protein [Kordia aestuariivivens]MBC8754921.1 hypothetical protein [Kordia aestuariivivens]
MKKAIIDYKKVTPELLLLLQERYPGGYRDRDIITFDDHHNNTIEAVEVKTNDTIYLVKVSSKLHYSMANIDSDSDDLDEIAPTPDIISDLSEE